MRTRLGLMPSLLCSLGLDWRRRPTFVLHTSINAGSMLLLSLLLSWPLMPLLAAFRLVLVLVAAVLLATGSGLPACLAAARPVALDASGACCWASLRGVYDL